MKVLRTSTERFEKLIDYPFTPHYLTIPDGEDGQLQIHYLDEGLKEQRIVLLLHGEPTWSYLYRKMIPGLVAAGHRVVAPDLVGFGKSDKPTKKSDYTIMRHIAWMEAWLKAMDLKRVTLFGQDWGSIIGLILAMRNSSRFERIVIANGGLPDPARRHHKLFLQAMANSYDSKALKNWRQEAATAKELQISDVMTRIGGGLTLLPSEKKAYDAPFPDASYQAGALVFPSLITPQLLDEDAKKILVETWTALDQWQKPFLTAYGKADPLLGWSDQIFQARVPGSKGQPHQEFPDATHFIQEQKPSELVEIINKFIALTK